MHPRIENINAVTLRPDTFPPVLLGCGVCTGTLPPDTGHPQFGHLSACQKHVIAKARNVYYNEGVKMLSVLR